MTLPAMLASVLDAFRAFSDIYRRIDGRHSIFVVHASVSIAFSVISFVLRNNFDFELITNMIHYAIEKFVCDVIGDKCRCQRDEFSSSLFWSILSHVWMLSCIRCTTVTLCLGWHFTSAIRWWINWFNEKRFSRSFFRESIDKSIDRLALAEVKWLNDTNACCFPLFFLLAQLSMLRTSIACAVRHTDSSMLY